MLKSASAVIVVLAVTTAMAQATPPDAASAGTPLTNRRNSFAGRRGMSSLAGNRQAGAPATMRQHLQDMEDTLVKMHEVLKQMRANAVKSHLKDPLAKANLDMWELMVGHLDKQLQELKIATTAREDMDARRAALYKQADAKAEAAAQAARAAQAQILAPAIQGTGGNTGGQTAGQSAAGQTSPTSPATASPSPN
jgi:hypothetical protein